MIDFSEQGNKNFKEIQLLIFDIIGIKFGVDIEQVSEIYELIDLGQMKGAKYGASWFHEKIPFRQGPVVYKSPRLLILRDQETTLGIIIDQPEDILSITLDDIHPLPSLLEALNRPAAIWGIALKDEKMILLVDFYKLFVNKEDKEYEN
ncbi:MAG TPA: chemotaxis protein CheW [Candidatus Limnocylindrales bacterium]|nr:chemotaxis protein CheW [Candidatus Limnocylindrales bacterium]